ncbi:hypothetical protein [Rhizobium sp. RU36D]|uniref:hypothetical protein n=1 Tax=Rhizobium sp. RU36D TaxID=1907415 RepID=UPI0009D86890|nr:hypothetical protein [Rhizobium sp. RU36D]SMC77789.1 hypothetical protein SAMN05880593_106222 [Rhizobium sp. RU36D]
MGAFRMRREPQHQDFDVLPPSHRQRTASQLAAGFEDDVSDAHFVVIDDRPHTASWHQGNDNKPSQAGRQGHSRYEVMFAHLALQGEAFLERFSERAFAVMVALIFGVVFMLASGLAATQTSSPSAGAPRLDITHATLTPQDRNGMRVLLINGIVENRSETSQAVPRIRADILNGGRLVASTFIDTDIAMLEEGHSRGFAARIQHPGGKSPDLRLSFVEQDVLAR